MKYLGELEEAESVALNALGGNLETFLLPGYQLLFNLRSMQHLAGIWVEQGKNGQAAALYECVSKAYSMQLGNLDIRTLTCKMQLAEALFVVGEYDTATSLNLNLLVQFMGNNFDNLSTKLMDDLVLSTAKFEPTISVYAMLLCTNMGRIALERGKYVEAEWFHTCALRISYVVLGREESGEPQFLDTANLLPLSRGEPRQLPPSITWPIVTSQALPVVLIRISNLAMVYINHPEYHALAKHLFRSALKGWELYKQHDAGLFATIGSLSVLLYNLGNLDEAEQFARRALGGRVALGGHDSVDSIECLSNLSVIKFGQQDYATAEAMQNKVLKVREEVYGMDHPTTLNSVSMLADIYFHQEQ